MSIEVLTVLKTCFSSTRETRGSAVQLSEAGQHHRWYDIINLPFIQVDDVIRTYKNDNQASTLMREEANSNMVCCCASSSGSS